MPINSQKVFTWTDPDFGVQVLTPNDLNSLRTDVKNAFDLKFDRPTKPWSKGDMVWYDGTNWEVLSGGSNDQLLTYVGATNVPTWKTLTIQVQDTFEYTGTAADGDILWYNGTNWVLLNRGTADQVLALNSSRDPHWKTLSSGFTYAGSEQRGDIIYRGSSDTWRLLRKGSSGQILEQGTNDPRWINKPDKSKVKIHTAQMASSDYITTGEKNYKSFASSAFSSIGGTIFSPYDSTDVTNRVDLAVLIGSLTFTPSSSNSLIIVKGYILDDAIPIDVFNIAAILLNSNTLTYQNLKNNSISKNQKYTTDDNDYYSLPINYNYTLNSNSSQTIKLYLCANKSTIFNITGWYIEAMEIY